MTVASDSLQGIPGVAVCVDATGPSIFRGIDGPGRAAATRTRRRRTFADAAFLPQPVPGGHHPHPPPSRPPNHGLPMFFTHPDVTGGLPTIAYAAELISNAVNPQATTPKTTLGVPAAANPDFPLTGMTGRPSVVHFAGVTQHTYTGKQLNGVRFVQIHPDTAAKLGIKTNDEMTVESRRGAITGTALLWPGLRPDTIFVPTTFGPSQSAGDEFGVPRYASVNRLTDDRHFDPLSGQQAYKCFACRVRKA